MARFFLLAAVVLWGWTFVAAKYLLVELRPLELVALRLGVGAPLLLAAALARGRRGGWPRRADFPVVLLGGAILAAHMAIQTAGLARSTASQTAWLVTVSPLLLVLLSPLLGERWGRRFGAGCALATLGVLLLVSDGRGSALRWEQGAGNWLALTSAGTWAVYTLLTRRLVARRDPLRTGAVIVAVAGTLVFLVQGPPVAAAGALSAPGCWALLFLAVPGLALAQVFWLVGVSRLGASRAGVYLYLEPLATLALAGPLLGERLGPVAIGGTVLLVAGVALGQERTRQPVILGACADATDIETPCEAEPRGAG